MMQPVNLNKVRKQRARREGRARADENAIKFGQTKAHRLLEKRGREKAAQKLDGHKRDQ